MSLTTILNITTSDTMLYPSVQWLDENNIPIPIDDVNYEASFSLILETRLAEAIEPEVYNTGVHWIDDAAFTLISAAKKKIYLDDNVYKYLCNERLISIDFELMKVVGVEEWDADKGCLPINVLRGWNSSNEIINTISHNPVDLATRKDRNWKGIIHNKYAPDSTAWDSTVWEDIDLLIEKGVPERIDEYIYLLRSDNSTSSHDKGSVVRICLIKDATAEIGVNDDQEGIIYYKWPIETPIVSPGRYLCQFKLKDKVNGRQIMLPTAAYKCGNERYLILNVRR